MSADVCQLCFEKSYHMKYNFNLEIQEFVEHFCQFVFQDNAYTLDEICMKCWQTLSQFNQFCDKIKGIHQKIEVTCPSSKTLLDFEEHTEVLEDDEIEETISTDPIEVDFKAVPMLSIESDVGDVGDVGDEGDSFDRRLVLTTKTLTRLEDQLKFEAKKIDSSEMDYDRMARFMSMQCCEFDCDLEFESLEVCYEHYLEVHGRSAYWNCCNLSLDTPYDVLDHLKYHECIDVFKCAACSKCFLTSNKLKYHIRRTHLPASGSLQCTNCDKECKSLRLLLTHQQCHIRISCPHCRKIVSAANYDHHVRTTHASHVPKKRKAIEKKSINKRPKDANKAIASGSQMTQSMELTPERNIRVQNLMIKLDPNENGMFECDICRMQFKQISLVFSHRNKVHV